MEVLAAVLDLPRQPRHSRICKKAYERVVLLIRDSRQSICYLSMMITFINRSKQPCQFRGAHSECGEIRKRNYRKCAGLVHDVVG